MTAPVKIVAPLARELAEAAATEVGACIRPLAVRRIDTQTGARMAVPIPCGATRATKCPPCAERARRLRMWQAQEGWHLDTDPEIVTAEPTAEQLAVIGYRADLESARAAALAENDTAAVTDLDRAIGDADDMVRAAGARGSTRPPGERKPRRVRSTRRRQDAPNLPRLPVAARTVGRTFDTPDGRRYRPSTFLTLTLPSYGRMYSDGSPVDPDRYDYRRAARDAIHFGDLVDRFWQNLRRAVGWNVQYFAAVEPQRRGAPHLHAAVRGTIPRKLLRQVAAATYHQVWWPPHDEPTYSPDRPPIWDETREISCYVDPDTGRPLRAWDDVLDELAADKTAPPAHVVQFGSQVDVQGVLGDTEQAGQCLRYLVKYLTKSLDECHEPDSTSAIAHVDRLADALRYEPCSPTCANWLLYGVAPEHAKAGLVPGLCKGKAHKRDNLGYGGRRCLVSRKWSGRNLTEHRTERREHVLRTLGVVGAAVEQSTPDGERERYTWEPIRPTDPDQPDRLELLLRLISERKRWREQYERARDQVAELPATDDRPAA
ncbi:hypothetical protein GCM10017691_13600 [Pseudonocardia petroleophila]|uniref:replication initiator n=1 Tax=Pseudonocardia petroleophila TaxID=37331 RepID=UPI001C8C9361|nr:replication initiator [Pseudonocardia petroleophila]